MITDLKVSVIIVNWNGRHLLEACLAGLKKQNDLPHEVVVVDNGSRDGSLEFLQHDGWPRLKWVALTENRGFGAGNNAALPHVSGDIYAILNNDAVPDVNWIAAAIPPFRNPQIGMVACKALRLEEPHIVDKAGHLIYPDGLNRGRGTGRGDGEAFSRQEEALWPDGSAGFFRASMVREIGFFDEDFFLYGEDAELGMRARWAGYECIYQPKSLVYHRHSATLGKFSRQKAYYIERNRLWVLLKTFPLTYILASPWHSLRRYGWNLVSLWRGKGSAASFRTTHSSLSLVWILGRAVWDGLRGAPRMLAKRKRLKRRLTHGQMKRILKKFEISAREIALRD